MNVAYITDDGFIEHCGVSILSLLENNQDLSELNVYVLSMSLAADNVNNLKSLCDTYNRKLTIIPIDDYIKKIGFQFNTTGFNPIVLARLFLAEYLPSYIDRVLYLDADVVVNDNISAVEGIDISNSYIAAVPELYMPGQNKKIIGFTSKDTYYNAGVLYINLQMWREHNLKESFLIYYKMMSGKLPYNDQDIINYCCKDYVVTLPQEYNMSPNLPFFPRWFMKWLQPSYFYEKDLYSQMIIKPKIIHYLGDERPWIKGNHNYYKDIYEKYKAISLWKDSPLIGGRERYMFCYHLLNMITKVFPHGRLLFSKFIGINIYKWKKK